MKKSLLMVKKHLIFLAITFAIIFNSCSLSKRVYMSGYQLDWLKSKKIAKTTTNKNEENNNLKAVKSITHTNIFDNAISIPASDLIYVSADNNSIFFNSKKANELNKTNKKFEDCDEIILKSADIIKAKIIDVGVSEIKYKKCDNLQGPTYNVLKSDVFMIKYANGTKDVFNIEKTKTGVPNDIINNNGALEGAAITSITTGILGFFIGLSLSTFIGAAFGILGIVFGGIAIKKIKNNPNKNLGSYKGMAITGLITGIISCLFYIIVPFIK